MKRLVPALLACSAAIGAPVGASTHFMDSSASLTGLQFELIDLRPDDGIAPALQVAGKAFVRARAGYGCPFAECREATGTAFSSELLVHAGDFGATAGVMSTSLEVTSFNNNPNDSGAFSGLSRFSGDRVHPLFVLTPHTAVKLTGQYRLEASVVNVDYASLEASARLRTWGANPGSTSVSVRAFNWDSPDTLHDDASGSFSATWSNSLGVTRNVWGGITLEANSVTLAVPEPGTYALMATGLGLIGTAVRRRRTGA